MFTKSADIYDAIYEASVDHAAASERIDALIQRHKRTPGMTLLDVACGTGVYLTHLRRHYTVEGLDLDAGMLDVARRKHRDIALYQTDMANFDLGRRFDVVICMGSSIGYVQTVPRLRQTLQVFVQHLVPGGVVIVERWFQPEEWMPGHLDALLVEHPDQNIARLSVSNLEGRTSILDMQYLVASSNGIEHLTEQHELGLFTRQEYLDAFAFAGLDVVDEPPGFLSGRGLYVAVAPLESASRHA